MKSRTEPRQDNATFLDTAEKSEIQEEGFIETLYSTVDPWYEEVTESFSRKA